MAQSPSICLARRWSGRGRERFYYQQISGDSGSGATLGDSRAHWRGAGVSYIRKLGKTTNLAAELKWLPELETKNRLKGNYIWFKLALLF
jgi:hypothetical protein